MRRILALLFFAVLAACAWAQESTALRVPRYDPSLLGDVIEASELWDFTDDEKRPDYAKGIGLTPLNWPYQKHAVDVYEPWSALTFVAWVYRDNLPETCGCIVGVTVYPLARKRAPCETFLRVPQGVGPVVLEGVAKPAGVSTNNVGTVAYNLTCDAAVTVDFGGGESETHEAGAYRDVEIKAAVDGDVTVTTDAETTWTLYAGTPRTATVTGLNYVPSDPYVTYVMPNRWCFVVHTLEWTDEGLVFAGKSYLPDGTLIVDSAESAYDHVRPVAEGFTRSEGAVRIVPFHSYNQQGDDTSVRPDQTKPSVLKLFGVRKYNKILTDEETQAILTRDAAELKRRGILTDKDFEVTTKAATARAAAAPTLAGPPLPRPLTEEEAEVLRKEAMP